MQKKIVPPPMKWSVRLKLKLQKLASKAKELTLSALAIVLIVSGLGYLVLKAPEIHGMYLRQEVGSKVYMIQGKLNGGGGTGFAVQAPSGQHYIVTNSHVCEGALSQSEDKTSLLVTNQKGQSMRRRVIENSDFTDLCLLEGLPGVKGLQLAGEPHQGETSYVVGHPRLRPMSVSKGEIVGATDVPILAYIMPGNAIIDMMAPHLVNKEGKCDAPKNKIEEIKETMIGPITICLNVTKAAYMSTIVIFGGNSGSPMVNLWGNVQGVAFATDDTNWGYIVSLSDLTRFLARY